MLLCCLLSFLLPPGRSLTLLDPTYASRFVPIIASVSEHQPPSWPSYITDLHFAALLAPAGIMAAFRKLDNGELAGYQRTASASHATYLHHAALVVPAGIMVTFRKLDDCELAVFKGLHCLGLWCLQRLHSTSPVITID